jgi:signal transduction histidine kinase
MLFLGRLSIRWRITLGSLLIAALCFGLATAAFRSRVESVLSSTNETLLEHDAAAIKELIRAGDQQIDRPGHGQLVSVVDPSGTVRRTSLPLSLDKRLSELLRLPPNIPSAFTTAEDTYLVLVQPIAANDGTWTIITARNLEATRLVLNRLTEAMLSGALILVAAFGVASWLLTGAALRPVSRMQRQAQALSEHGFGQSFSDGQALPVGPARDELSALATTLNEFISQQHRVAARERQMVSDASHELRGPIAVLKSQLELAHLSHGDAAALEAEISTAERSVARLSALSTKLLELSEAESDQGPQVSSWKDLTAELAEAADRARLLAAATQTTIDFDIAEGRPQARYPIAVSRFGRLVDNLTTNAVHALPDGGLIHVCLEQSPEHVVPAHLRLTVTDTGPGMPEEFLPIAFDRFSRPDQSRGTGTGGSGLGLAIAHAIVRSATGQITLRNRPEGGLGVTVVLPSIADAT